MKLEPHIILKLFLTFSDYEPQYSYKLYSYKQKNVLKMSFYKTGVFFQYSNFLNLFMVLVLTLSKDIRGENI